MDSSAKELVCACARADAAAVARLLSKPYLRRHAHAGRNAALRSVIGATQRCQHAADGDHGLATAASTGCTGRPKPATQVDLSLRLNLIIRALLALPCVRETINHDAHAIGKAIVKHRAWEMLEHLQAFPSVRETVDPACHAELVAACARNDVPAVRDALTWRCHRFLLRDAANRGWCRRRMYLPNRLYHATLYPTLKAAVAEIVFSLPLVAGIEHSYSVTRPVFLAGCLARSLPLLKSAYMAMYEAVCCDTGPQLQLPGCEQRPLLYAELNVACAAAATNFYAGLDWLLSDVCPLRTLVDVLVLQEANAGEQSQGHLVPWQVVRALECYASRFPPMLPPYEPASWDPLYSRPRLREPAELKFWASTAAPDLFPPLPLRLKAERGEHHVLAGAPGFRPARIIFIHTEMHASPRARMPDTASISASEVDSTFPVTDTLLVAMQRSPPVCHKVAGLAFNVFLIRQLAVKHAWGRRIPAVDARRRRQYVGAAVSSH